VELFTLNRQFIEQDVIDKFVSVIWTERYYGDSEVELIVPATSDMVQKLTVGTFLGLVGSGEIMLIDTVDIESGTLKATGSSLMVFLNNRFIRLTPAHEDRYWYMAGLTPGMTMWYIVYYMCIGGPYLDGSINTGIPNPASLIIPGLYGKAIDNAGAAISYAAPYGPVYDALREIGTTYQVGMQITLDSVTDTSYALGFRCYRGLDHTSGQSVNTVIRFSPQMDSLANIKELQSNKSQKTLVYSFAPGNPDGLATVAGVSSLAGAQYTGFDLRAMLTFEEDITTDQVGGDPNNLVSILNSRANLALTDNRFQRAIDGEIVPLHQFQYGVDYNLGDVIEVQGNSDIIQTSMVTEYIRAQDNAGEKAYPTVAMLG
jgi:hypothetical protein